jgi:hypothetical protein
MHKSPRIVRVRQENHREVNVAQLHREVRKNLSFVLMGIMMLCSEHAPRLCETVHDYTLGALQVVLGPFFDFAGHH